MEAGIRMGLGRHWDSLGVGRLQSGAGFRPVSDSLEASNQAIPSSLADVGRREQA